MQTGDIVFVREKGLIPSIIRFFDKGKFNHVAIFVSDTEIIEAEYNTRVHITPFQYDDYEIISFNLTDEQKNRVKEFAKKFVGEKYDLIEIVSIWLRICFGITELGKFNSPKQVICSELVAYFLEDLKLTPLGVELLAPNELFRFLKYKLNNK
jgi:hypothetical protein